MPGAIDRALAFSLSLLLLWLRPFPVEASGGRGKCDRGRMYYLSDYRT